MHYDSTWDDADTWPEYPESDGKELDAFGGSYSAADHDGDGTLDLNEEHLEVSFTVTNPSGSLSATAGLGGRIQRIDVLNVSGVDETRLGEELAELALLAREKARAAQHEVTVELMAGLGQDRAEIRSLLVNFADLPTYESASAHRAKAFTARLGSEDD